ncbi:MAG: hypothetical protein QOF54_631 [Solirubrobacteraceae bacterium]|nr:hypothetical protein [Solirubrobacteraceae bacterium]
MTPAPEPARLLRSGVLDGVGVLVVGAEGLAPSNERAGDRDEVADRDESTVVADAVAAACAELGARVWRRREELPEPASVDVLAIDAAGLFWSARAEAVADGAASPAAAAREALRRSLELAWEITSAVANEALIAPRRAGRVVYLAPGDAGDAGDAGDPGDPGRKPALVHVDAARAALENLARTLSIEWARYEITTATIALRGAGAAADAATLVAYLCSPAGAYFSGCVFELGRR